MYLIWLIASFSTLVFSNDYSNCQYGDLRGRLNEEGKIVAREGEIIKKSSLKDGVETIEIGSSDPRSKDTHTIKLTVFRDKLGNVTGYENILDLSTLTKKEMNQIRDIEAYKMAFSDSPGCKYTGFQETYINEQGEKEGSGGFAPGGGCSSVAIRDERGHYKPANFYEINKTNYKDFKEAAGNLSWEEFEAFRKQDKKKFKDREKIAKLMSKVLEKRGFSVANGEKVTLKKEDGKCFIESVSKSLVDSRGNVASLVENYNVNLCRKVSQAYLKFGSKIKSCEEINREAKNELGALFSSPNLKTSSNEITVQMYGGSDGKEISRINHYEDSSSLLKTDFGSLLSLKENCEFYDSISKSGESGNSSKSSVTRQ